MEAIFNVSYDGINWYKVDLLHPHDYLRENDLSDIPLPVEIDLFKIRGKVVGKINPGKFDEIAYEGFLRSVVREHFPYCEPAKLVLYTTTNLSADNLFRRPPRNRPEFTGTGR